MSTPLKTLLCFALLTALATSGRAIGDDEGSVKGSDAGSGQLAEYQERQIGLTFPKEIGQFKLDSVHNFDPAEAGVGIRYSRAKLMSVDVFVYNGGLTTIPADVDSMEVRNCLNSAIEDIEKAGREGSYPGLEIESQKVADLVDGGPKAHIATFRFGAGELHFRSRLYLLAYKNHFIKVRATWPIRDEEAFTKELDGLIAWLGGALNHK